MPLDRFAASVMLVLVPSNVYISVSVPLVSSFAGVSIDVGSDSSAGMNITSPSAALSFLWNTTVSMLSRSCAATLFQWLPCAYTVLAELL